jgi:hypothetical protein
MDFCDYDLIICVLILVLLYLTVSSDNGGSQKFLNGPAQGGADSLIGYIPHIDRRIIS